MKEGKLSLVGRVGGKVKGPGLEGVQEMSLVPLAESPNPLGHHRQSGEFRCPGYTII